MVVVIGFFVVCEAVVEDAGFFVVCETVVTVTVVVCGAGVSAAEVSAFVVSVLLSVDLGVCSASVVEAVLVTELSALLSA